MWVPAGSIYFSLTNFFSLVFPPAIIIFTCHNTNCSYCQRQYENQQQQRNIIWLTCWHIVSRLFYTAFGYRWFGLWRCGAVFWYFGSRWRNFLFGFAWIWNRNIGNRFKMFFKLSFHFQITDYVSKILFPAFESIRILFIICFCRIFGCNRSIAIFDRLCGNDLAVTDKFNRICLLSACSSI